MANFYNYMFFRMYEWQEHMHRSDRTYVAEAVIALSGVFLLNLLTVAFLLELVTNSVMPWLTYFSELELAAIALLIPLVQEFALKRNDNWKRILSEYKNSAKYNESKRNQFIKKYVFTSFALFACATGAVIHSVP